MEGILSSCIVQDAGGGLKADLCQNQQSAVQIPFGHDHQEEWGVWQKRRKLITPPEVLYLKQKLGNKGGGSRSILMYLDDANKTEGL